VIPTIATDPTDATRVYVAWSSCTASAQADVFLSHSSDGGATWSPTPLRVNDDGASNPRDQFFPWITVDDFGVVRAMWGDDRLDLVHPGGHDYDIFAAASTDHGASVGANLRVTTQSSNPDVNNGGTFIGDYNGIAPCGTPVWGGTRNGNLDIFAAGLAAAATGIFPFCTKTNQTIAFATPADRTYGDADFSVSATASSGMSVSFAASGSCTLSGARIHLTSPGSCSVTASQAGNAIYNPAVAVRAFSIAKKSQTITFGPLGNKKYGAAKFGVSATASSGLPVSFDADGSCTVTGSTVRITGAGLCTVTASQPGDSTYAAAESVSRTFSILRPPCTVPKLVGKRLSAAKSAIKKRHCALGKVRRAYSHKRKGSVISQSRRPGRVLAGGSKINLVVSRGRKH
jgi:hypothetical protein